MKSSNIFARIISAFESCMHAETQEPSVVELKDGSILMVIRTSLGYIYKSYFRNGGAHWTNAQPTTLISPVSPATIKRIPTVDLLLTQNKSPHKRCPLASTVSQDEGEIWRTFKNIETAERYNYAYPSVTFVEKEAFSTYWISHTVPLQSLKLKSLPIDWFYARATSKTAILFHFVLYHSTD